MSWFLLDFDCQDKISIAIEVANRLRSGNLELKENLMPFDDYEGELTGTAIGSLVLMSMNGVGSVTVNALMSRFKSLGDIRTAELSQLTQIMRRVPPSLRI